MRVLKVKEAVVINSKFEEKAVTEWLEENQPEVKWRREAPATKKGFELEFPYYLLRSEYNCLGFDRINSDIEKAGYTVINLDLLGKELPKEESPSEAIYRLTRDKVVVETAHHFGNGFSDREVMAIVLNGSILTDEYYFELKEAINKLKCGIQFTVKIKY